MSSIFEMLLGFADALLYLVLVGGRHLVINLFYLISPLQVLLLRDLSPVVALAFLL